MRPSWPRSSCFASVRCGAGSPRCGDRLQQRLLRDRRRRIAERQKTNDERRRLSDPSLLSFRIWRVAKPVGNAALPSPCAACHPEYPIPHVPRVIQSARPPRAPRVIQSAQPYQPEGYCNEREGSPVGLAGCCQGLVSLRRRSFALITEGIEQRWLGALDDTPREEVGRYG